jgi:hypothetical protein
MAKTTLEENITIKGLDNINETFEIKPLEIKPVTITNKNELTVTKPVEVKLTTDSKSDAKSDSKSDSKSDAKLDLKIEPLKIDSDQRSALDVKPLVIDSCQTSVTKLAPLPPTAVDQPYAHHFGVTFMGMELWGFNLSGRSGVTIESPPRRHSVVTIPSPASGRCCDPEPRAEPPRRGIKVRVAGQTIDR